MAGGAGHERLPPGPSDAVSGGLDRDPSDRAGGNCMFLTATVDMVGESQTAGLALRLSFPDVCTGHLISRLHMQARWDTAARLPPQRMACLSMRPDGQCCGWQVLGSSHRVQMTCV
jgi:hypothetical protein